MAQQEVDQVAIREAKSFILPSAKPHQDISDKYDPVTGQVTPGRFIKGSTNPGTLPMRDIPFQEFPALVYLHPKKPFKKMLLPVDGHGNKEWQWVANQAKDLKVANAEELAAALKKGYQKKHYVVPPLPVEDPEEDAAETK
jgi:hypothetical protein